MQEVFYQAISLEGSSKMTSEKAIMLQLTNLLAQQHLITPDEKAQLTIRIKGGNTP